MVEAVISRPRERFPHVFVNLIGPLGKSKDHNYVITIVDGFSRFFSNHILMLALPQRIVYMHPFGTGFPTSAVSSTLLRQRQSVY